MCNAECQWPAYVHGPDELLVLCHSAWAHSLTHLARHEVTQEDIECLFSVCLAMPTILQGHIIILKLHDQIHTQKSASYSLQSVIASFEAEVNTCSVTSDNILAASCCKEVNKNQTEGLTQTGNSHCKTNQPPQDWTPWFAVPSYI